MQNKSRQLLVLEDLLYNPLKGKGISQNIICLQRGSHAHRSAHDNTCAPDIKQVGSMEPV